MPPFVYRVTPYDPAAAEQPAFLSWSDRTRMADELAEWLASLALERGLTSLTLDNPMAEGFFGFRWGRPDPLVTSGPFHDGAVVPLDTGLALVRAMVARSGPWCRLTGEGGFFVHVGEHDDVYVGSNRPCAPPGGAALSARRVGYSPYDPERDTVEPARAADGGFWEEVAALVAARGPVLLEERPAGYAYRWHRLTRPTQVTDLVRQLAPRARLAVWPDLSEDAQAVRAEIRALAGPAVLLVVERPGKEIWELPAEPWMGRDDYPYPHVEEGPGHRAGLVPLDPADRHPLLAAVLPDADGMLRARWRADRTRAEKVRAYLGGLRVGDVVTGVVATGLHDVGVYVDLDGDLGRGLGFLKVPEMSWRHIDALEGVAPVGREIRAEVLGIAWRLEYAELSLKALQPDPWAEPAPENPLPGGRGTGEAP
ncbi:S1 RNA-binding domain-containing protein [Streptomyces sp. NPDC054956]